MAIQPIKFGKNLRPSTVEAINKINELVAKVNAATTDVDKINELVTKVNGLVTKVNDATTDIDKIKVTLYTPLSNTDDTE
jgi:wobble nucleotide-excising tRNase